VNIGFRAYFVVGGLALLAASIAALAHSMASALVACGSCVHCHFHRPVPLPTSAPR